VSQDATPQSVAALATPCVTIDLDRLKRNLARWQDRCEALGLRFRPHVKTHKTVEVARMQLALGASGITCQTMGEAEIFATAGFSDIFLARQVVGADKLRRLSDLLRGGVELTALCDDEALVGGLRDAARASETELRVLVDCDTGGGRTGVSSPAEATQLARTIAAAPGLVFGGLCTHPVANDTVQWLLEARSRLERADLAPPVISAGGTSALRKLEELQSVVDEYRAGNYVYLDLRSIEARAGTLNDVALTVLTTVISRPAANRAVLDAGSKTLTHDPLPGKRGFGLIPKPQKAVIDHLYEEHGVVEGSSAETLALGDRVNVVPNHACPISNLVDDVWITRNGLVLERWHVAARGASG
jgi:D-serine deaminase-like pyridoxal phosphate-dependent protein